MISVISSLQNPKIKGLVKLRQAKHRRSAGVFLVEGARETSRALSQRFHAVECYFCPDLSKGAEVSVLNALPDACAIYSVTSEVYEKIAVRAGSEGIIVVLTEPSTLLNVSFFEKKSNPLIIACEGLEKPGNLGAVLRTADGMGADAVIAVDSRVDVFSPQAVRASVGAIFSVPLFTCGSEELLGFSESLGLTIVAISPDSKLPYTEYNYSSPSLILFGAEDTGLSLFWRNHVTGLQIPMHGIGDSLNLSVAVAVIAYEALRQRS